MINGWKEAHRIANLYAISAMASRRLFPSIRLCFVVAFYALFLHLSVLDRSRHYYQDIGTQSASLFNPNTSESSSPTYDSATNWRTSREFSAKRAYKPASDEEWTKAIQDGCQDLRLMRADAKTNAEMFGTSENPKTRKIPAQSPWSNPEDIENWGWTITQDESKWVWSGFNWADITTPLQALGLSTKSEDWDFVQTQHTKGWEVDGVKGPVRCSRLRSIAEEYFNFVIRQLTWSMHPLVSLPIFNQDPAHLDHLIVGAKYQNFWLW